MDDFSALNQLREIITNDPVMIGKWILVFAVVVIMYVIIIKFKITDIFDPSVKLEKKVQKAIKDGHVIEGKLIDSWHNRDDDNNKTYHGTYEYEINGKKRKYRTIFLTNSKPPSIIHLFYNKSPRRLFAKKEYHYNAILGIPFLIIYFSPFLVGAYVAWLLGLAR